jgi:hypothetical protein
MKQRIVLKPFFFPSRFGVVSIVTWHTFEYLQVWVLEEFHDTYMLMYPCVEILFWSGNSRGSSQ